MLHLHSLAIAALACLAFNPTARAQSQPPPTPSVVVAPVAERDVTPTLEFVGRVEAQDQVELRARVQGFLEQRVFVEGASVDKGDLLFVIEKAPYEIAVSQAKANLAGAEASLANARAKLKRNLELRKQQAVSQADLDQAEADEANARATVLQMRAALDRVELDLAYTEIRSPLDGRINEARYSEGNLVGPDSDPLATVTRVDPIHVNVAISEKRLIDARRRGIDLDNPRFEPLLLLGDGSAYEYAGRFDYIDTEVDRRTDTVLVRALFPNPENLLLPGQFVRVVARGTEPATALAVPQAAVQEDRSGYYVLVVDAESKVEVRRIVAGDQVDSDWVVNDGLSKGERVIVQGVQKVQPGMTVNAVSDGG